MLLKEESCVSDITAFVSEGNKTFVEKNFTATLEIDEFSWMRKEDNY